MAAIAANESPSPLVRALSQGQTQLIAVGLGLLVVAIGYGLNVSKLRRVCIGVTLLNFALMMVLV